MSAQRKLPAEAFEYYVGLGDERSYQAVADHFGVTKRAVSKHAAADDWPARLKALQQKATEQADERAGDALETQRMRRLMRLAEFQDAFYDVATPQRMKAVVASLINEAAKKGDVQAARLLFERVFGKPRGEPLPATALDIPDGLETAADVRRAANALVQAVADGSLAPEDAQKAAAVIEAARRSVETEDLDARITELEKHAKREKRR